MGNAAYIDMRFSLRTLTFRTLKCYTTKNFMASSTLRSALQKEAADNLEFGEAIFTMLKRKTERQLELIAPAQNGEIVEVLGALLHMHEVQATLLRERFRLSVLNSYR